MDYLIELEVMGGWYNVLASKAIDFVGITNNINFDFMEALNLILADKYGFRILPNPFTDQII